ncbi:DNA-directed RNA polymerase I subunit RPA34 isoform X1 [Pseudonaja textilis]|uniref:DNA-directed RNA polymerase I subunit RPA34 isoform X1 n=1 Tax=Pseudonaja textilis TaxID=8673 RepID=UPI000EA8CB99|nr:DNA-directed RNA polymerase I subunit RPA34 isoform X1 [Pseudonaja textilis]
MGAPGGAAASGLPAGPARFRCPEDFCARCLDPGAAICLGAPGKRLLLIRAPADFRPESLSGHRLPLLGSPLLRTSQPDGSQKVYGLRATREESVARLLIAAGRPERLVCAQPFGGSLKIQERDSAPDAPRPLFPVPERPPPKVPAGLKQRFFPFGARLPSSGAPPRKVARARGKKRPLLLWKQALWPSEGPEQRPLKEEAEEPAAAAAPGPATLPGLGGRLLWQDARPSGHLEEASWSGEAGRRARKKAKKRKTRPETEELPNPSSRYWQPEWELRLQGGREAEMPEAGAEGLWGAAATKEEPGDAPCLGSLLEENPRGTGEDPAGEVPSGKKKKKKERRSRERAAEGLWGLAAIKEEPGDALCLGHLPEEHLGPAGELLACKKEKLDKEPLWEQGTETQQRLESNVLDWAAPLWQEAEGLEEPWQRNGAAPRPKKKGRRREREDQAGLFAAGT